MRRLTSAAVLLACLTALGCVEGTQTFTLNPDGSGKVRIDVVMVPPIELTPSSSGDRKAEKGKKKDESLDQMLAKQVKGFFDAKGVDAWADVSASYALDGRVKFAGTAYFKKYEKLEITNVFLIGSPIRLAPQPDGSLILEAEKRDRRVPAEFAQNSVSRGPNETERYAVPLFQPAPCSARA